MRGPGHDLVRNLPYPDIMRKRPQMRLIYIHRVGSEKALNSSRERQSCGLPTTPGGRELAF